MAKTVKRKKTTKKSSNTGDWKFSISEALSYGWEKTTKFFWITVGIWFISWIVSAVFDIIFALVEPPFGLLVWLFSMYISIMISLGWTRTALNVLSGKTPALAYFYDTDNHKYFWSYIGTCCLYSLIVFAGMLLFIIPGIVWGYTYALAPILAVDKKLSPTKALAMSRKLVTGQRWNLFVFYLVLIGLIVLGFLCLGIGLLVAAPLSFYAAIYVYGKLTGKAIK